MKALKHLKAVFFIFSLILVTRVFTTKFVTNYKSRSEYKQLISILELSSKIRLSETMQINYTLSGKNYKISFKAKF